MTCLRMIGLATLLALASACADDTLPTAPDTNPVVENFSSQLGVRGVASRTFTVSSAGTVAVLLKQVGPPADVSVGLGLGIPRADSRSCSLTRSLTTGASSVAQISLAAEAGTYCVQVFDPGTLPGEVTFSIDVTHP